MGIQRKRVNWVLDADIQLLGSFGVREILSRTPKGYWTVSVRFIMLCALVVVSVAVATTV